MSETRASDHGLPGFDTIFSAVIDGKDCTCKCGCGPDPVCFNADGSRGWHVCLQFTYDEQDIWTYLLYEEHVLDELMLLKLADETGPPLRTLTDPPNDEQKREFSVQMARDFMRYLNAVIVEKGDGVITYASTYKRPSKRPRTPESEKSYRGFIQENVCDLIFRHGILPRHYRFEEVKW